MAVPSDDARAEREEILELVAEAMEALDTGGEPALQDFCARLVRHRQRVLERIATLRGAGMLGGAPRDADAPQRLGDYELQERIGGGGMGVVHRARHAGTGREAAVKLVRADQLFFPGVRERFQREIAIVSRLQHDGIVRLFDFGEDRGVPWFAMELVRGLSLTDVLQRFAGRRARDLTGGDLAAALAERGWPPEPAAAPFFAGTWTDVAVRLVAAAAQALAEAHGKGVLHRDLKPSNVMVTAGGRVVLLDFGLARTQATDKLTRTGAQLGSIHYMAPEQVRGDAVDERSDVYALGVVLRELLTLRVAFQGSNAEAVAQRILAGEATAFEKADSRPSRDRELVCATAMDVEPERRYPGAIALQRDLEHLLAGRPIAARPPSMAHRVRRFARRHRAIASAVAVAVLAIVVAPFVVALRERELRVALQQSNETLAAAMARASGNVDLAAAALSRTLAAIEDEDLAQVPDLRTFVDQVLVDSWAFQDALLRSNPTEPEARRKLAATLSQAAMLHWQIRDHARAEATYRRVLELLDGSDEERDRADVLELEARLQLAGVIVSKHRDRLAAEALLAEGLDRVARHGAIDSRPAAVRACVAKVLERLGRVRLTLRRTDPTALFDESLRLRRAIAAAAPSAETWFEVVYAERAFSDTAASRAVRDVHRDALDEALRAADGLAGDSARIRTELGETFRLRADELRRDDRMADAVPYYERALVHVAWLVERRPSRMPLREQLWWSWKGMSECYVALGRSEEAVAACERVLRDVDATTSVWPDAPPAMREACDIRQVLANRLPPGPEALPRRRALFDEAIEWARRLQARRPPLATAHSTASWALQSRARFRVHQGDAEGALADVEAALAAHAVGNELGPSQGVSMGSEAPLRCVQAEVLLHVGRADEAFAVLEALGDRLPRDLRAQVPALERVAADPRAAALLARAGGKG